MADPITVYDQDHAGHIITIPLAFSSGGATTAVELTITAGYPHMDLTKAHPVISGLLYETEDDNASGSVALLPSAEIARSDTSAPDTAGEYQITGANTIKVCNGAGNKDGIVLLTYWAAGNKAV